MEEDTIQAMRAKLDAAQAAREPSCCGTWRQAS